MSSRVCPSSDASRSAFRVSEGKVPSNVIVIRSHLHSSALRRIEQTIKAAKTESHGWLSLDLSGTSWAKLHANGPWSAEGSSGAALALKEEQYAWYDLVVANAKTRALCVSPWA